MQVSATDCLPSAPHTLTFKPSQTRAPSVQPGVSPGDVFDDPLHAARARPKPNNQPTLEMFLPIT
jgi:hypothetical protein